ncbi:MAG: hypothetical protein IJO97_03885 [Lachnospiraceae bacterium]|nr:hypothetical protein [Lachnospiraceae bacterium]
MKKNTKIIIIVIIAAVAVSNVALFLGAFGLLIWSSMTAEIEVYEDASDYNRYMGENADEEYQNKWGMDESIFPQALTEDMNVLEYKMVYYNPWDAQYLSYLTVEYDEADYEQEMLRLSEYESTEYEGYYGATGFDANYELAAMNADSYQGFVYALTDGEDTITYVEIIFCNYFMDIAYEEYIPNEYLPIGFDATNGNPYGERIREEQ